MRTKETALSAAAILAIREYDVMREIGKCAVDSIKEVYGRITSPRSSVPDGMPHAHNPRTGENIIAAGLDRLEGIKKRNAEALFFLSWFEPMWKALSDAEREILETYKFSDRLNGEIAGYAEAKNISVRQANRLRRKALNHLGLLLYGSDWISVN